MNNLEQWAKGVSCITPLCSNPVEWLQDRNPNFRFCDPCKRRVAAHLPAAVFTHVRLEARENYIAVTVEEETVPAKPAAKPQEMSEADRPKMMCPHCRKDHPLYQTKTTLGEGAGWRFTTLTIACECGMILAVQLLHSAPIAGGKPS